MYNHLKMVISSKLCPDISFQFSLLITLAIRVPCIQVCQPLVERSGVNPEVSSNSMQYYCIMETFEDCIYHFPDVKNNFLLLEPKPCDSSPCKNGGTCTNEGESFSCKCAEDFQGETCEGICNVRSCLEPAPSHQQINAP